MNTLNISEILGKINELRAVFILGQRAVPFLEEVFYFLKEISPLMDEINLSIRESTHKMPSATSQLQSVTQATELATTEILDLVDVVLGRLGQTRAQLEQNGQHLNALKKADLLTLELLRDELLDRNPALLEQLACIHEEKERVRNLIADNLNAKLRTFDEIREKMNQIMISLQVQDITSQQIAAVNHLIESIRGRMSKLMERLTSDELEDALPPAVMESGSVFDANASYDRSGQRQAYADDVMRNAAFPAPGSEVASATSQDDIDQLFGGDGSSSTASQTDIDQLFGQRTPVATPEPGTYSSQVDIDQLFSQGFGASDSASQDDIDKLFGAGF